VITANMIYTQKGIFGLIYHFVKLGRFEFPGVNSQSRIGPEVSPGMQENKSCKQINF